MSELDTEEPAQDFFDLREHTPARTDAVWRELAEPDSPVLVDFDHTLFASNSTELFISRCRPSLVVALLEFAVRGCLPWRLVPGGRGYRIGDYLCVVLIVVLTPWNVWLWRREAPGLFEQHRAAGVAAMLTEVERSRLTIISFGMAFVIRGLLQGSEFQSAALIATPLLARPSWFAGGKTAAAVEGIGESAVARAVFISDSLDDADLLTKSRSGLLILRQGEPTSARERLYLPLRYTARVKFTPSYTLDQFLLVDTLVIAIAVGYDIPSLLHFLVIVPLLLASLMSIYEVGYFENDMHAAKSERHPVLSPRVSRFRDYPIHVQSWVWAAALAAAGLGAAVRLDELAGDDLTAAGLSWFLLLVVLRAVFYVYNRTRTEHRMFLYPLLQALKYGGVFLVFVPSVLGVALVLSQIMAMWVTYVVYRLGGRKSAVDRVRFCMATFLIAAGLLGVAHAVHGGPLGQGTDEQTANLVCFVAAVLWSLARSTKTSVTRRVKASSSLTS